MIIYNKNNKLNNNENNNFNKISKIFQSNDSNLLQENQINIPDKVSIIDANQSNLINAKISNNHILLIQEQTKKRSLNQNKGMKLHDFIRKEEKDGGVIGKDFDFKENDFFKINTPLFSSELGDILLSSINFSISIYNYYFSFFRKFHF